MSVMFRRDWIALPGSQRLFLSSPVFETLYEGTRGPGKTESLLMKFARHCGRGFGSYWRGIIFRQTYKQLTDAVIKTQRWFPRFFPGIKYNGSDFTWTWPGGEQLLLRYMKSPADYWNYHGHEYPFIGWEELTNWSTGECYESMKSCSRSSLPGMPRIYDSTANPFGVGHGWVKQYFIDPAPSGKIIRTPTGSRVSIHGSVLENKPLLEADPDYLNKLRSIANSAKRRAWLHGDWNIVAGGMFDEVWDADVNVIYLPFVAGRTWSVMRSFDWGSSKPFSVGWWAVSDGTPCQVGGETRHMGKGSLVRIGEWYGWNGEANVGLHMTSDRIGAGIVEREQTMGIHDTCEPGPADASIFDMVDGKCIADTLALCGAPFVPAAKGPGSRKNGWEEMRTMMSAALDPRDNDSGACLSEDPALFVLSSCRQFLRTVPVLPRDATDMDDVDTESEDHIGDEARYMVTFKPSTVTQEGLYGRHG